jgi:hypothetical protein
VVEEDEFVLVLNSKRAEDDGVHQGEDGGVGANAETQRHNRGGSEPGLERFRGIRRAPSKQ